MLDLNTELYYATINDAIKKTNSFWDERYKGFGPRAKLCLDIALFFNKNSFVARDGEWPCPWKYSIAPGFEMPKYDSKFSMNFEEVTNKSALEIRDLIKRTDKRVAVYYSGGIDSTVCLIALLKNLTPEELKHIDLCLSSESIIENPYLFVKHITRKFNILDSAKIRYSEIEQAGNFAITCDQGDSVFGTEFGTHIYYNYRQLLQKVSPETRRKLENYYLKISAAEVHYSEFADLLIAYFEHPRDPSFGRHFYEALVQNIKTASVPIHSLHDFFWWIIFNLKYMECALRSSIYYYGGTNYSKSINETIINWFNHENYQKWSMVNNNTGQKIRGSTAATYKWAAREYIQSYDKNDWFFRHKLKLSSLKPLIWRNEKFLEQPHIFGLTKNYEILLFNEPGVFNFIFEKLQRFG